ncbi:hypothetical protein ACFYZJ_10295 [Streptomyces sp. NPDC001848]|uniref:hypothetical protein n=1 Tax=Streptomyces sp. NPDC001848 TaxID=3364618 RepID=UPI00369503D4
MTHGANAAPAPNPRADATSAFGCETCSGWGTVITQGRHELCFTCQPHTDEEDDNSTTSQTTPQPRNA